MDVVFYQMQEPLEKVLGKLLEKIYESGQRAVVILKDEEQMKAVNASLWTYRTMAFLPHGCALDTPMHQRADQPIWLSTENPADCPNAAAIAVVCDLRPVALEDRKDFTRLVFLLNGTPEMISLAQSRKRLYQDAVWWSQDEKGNWNRQA